MYISDLRGGCIRIDSLLASIEGMHALQSLKKEQAIFLVEQEEDAYTLRSRHRIPCLYPSHGPSGIRILADYESMLRDRHIVCLFRNDIVGHNFSQTAARILSRFAKPRLLPVNVPVRDWLHSHTHYEIGKALPRPLREGELHSVPVRDWLKVTGTRVIEEGYAGIWDDQDRPDLLTFLDEQKLFPVYLSDRRIPEEFRLRSVPIRCPSESLDEYALRTGC